MLKNSLVVMNRQLIDNKYLLAGIIIIKDDDAERYADYWIEEEQSYAQDSELHSIIEKLKSL